MTILDQLAGCARERTGQAKLRISLEELKQQALSLPKGNFTFEKAIRLYFGTDRTKMVSWK